VNDQQRLERHIELLEARLARQSSESSLIDIEDELLVLYRQLARYLQEKSGGTPTNPELLAATRATRSSETGGVSKPPKTGRVRAPQNPSSSGDSRDLEATEPPSRGPTASDRLPITLPQGARRGSGTMTFSVPKRADRTKATSTELGQEPHSSDQFAVKQNGWGVAGLSISILGYFIYEVGLVPLLGLAASIVGLATFDVSQHKNRWMATVGLIIGSIGTLLYLYSYGYIG
jgi:hypothetical protein